MRDMSTDPQGSPSGAYPVEQPTKFPLVVNLKTATALGPEIPAALLARAGEHIVRLLRCMS